MNPFYEKAIDDKDILKQDRCELLAAGDTAKLLAEKLRGCGIEPQVNENGEIRAVLGKAQDGAPQLLVVSEGDPSVIFGAARLLKGREEYLPAPVEFLFRCGGEKSGGEEGGTEAADGCPAVMKVESAACESSPGIFQCLTCGQGQKHSRDYVLKASAPKGLRGVNPITITARIDLAIKDLIASEYGGQQVEVETLKWDGGTAPNAGAESAELAGRVSAQTEETAEQVRRDISLCAKQITESYRAQFEETWETSQTPQSESFGLQMQLAGYMGDAAGWERMQQIAQPEAYAGAKIPTAAYRYMLDLPEQSTGEIAAAGAAACANAVIHYLKSRNGMTGGARS